MLTRMRIFATVTLGIALLVIGEPSAGAQTQPVEDTQPEDDGPFEGTDPESQQEGEAQSAHDETRSTDDEETLPDFSQLEESSGVVVEWAPEEETAGTGEEASTDSPADEPAADVERVVNLTGVIKEAGTRRPLADLEIFAVKGDEQASAMTDGEGRFAFENLAPGSYRVIIATTDHERLETEEEVIEGQRTEVKYYLEPRVYGGLEVVVHGRRLHKEVSRTVLKIDEARFVPGTGGDAAKVVDSLPGVARGGGGNNDGVLVMRGSNGEDSKIYLDGHQIWSLYHFGGLKSTYNSLLLDSIALYPGGFSAKSGNATGGVVELKSRAPRTDRFGGFADISLIDASIMLEGPIGEKTSFALGARRSTFDLVMMGMDLDDKIDGLQFTQYPAYYDYQGKLHFSPAPKHELVLDIYGMYDSMKLNLDKVADEEPEMTGQMDTAWSAHGLFVHHKYDGEVFTSDFSPGVALYDSKFEMGKYFIRSLWKVVDINEDVTAKVGKGNTLLAGLRLQPRHMKLESNFVRPPKEGEVGWTFANSEPVEAEFASSDIIISGYLMDEFEAGRWTIIPGVNVLYESITRDYSVDPRLTVRFKAAEPLVLKAAGGIYHRVPDDDEILGDFGQPDLDFERAIHAVGGFELTIGKRFTIDVQGYYKWLDHLVSAVDDPEPGQTDVYDNGGKGYVWGGEVLLRHEWSENFFGWVAYSLSRSMRDDGDGNGYRRFDMDQTHNLIAVASWQFAKGWRLGGRFQLTSGEPYTEIISSVYNADNGTYVPVYDPTNKNNKTMPTYHRLDLRLDKIWSFDTWILSAYLDIQNVYFHSNVVGTINNYDYSEQVYFKDLPILPSIGVSAQF